MIVAQQKPLEQIRQMLAEHKKVLAVGCGTCVTVCFSGGAKEVGILSSALRMSAGLEGETLETVYDVGVVGAALEIILEDVDRSGLLDGASRRRGRGLLRP